MNLTELRDALDELAGPVEAATSTDRRCVQSRVRRSRIVRMTSAVAVSLVVLVGVVVVATSWDGDDQPTHVVTASGTTVHDEKFGYTVTIPPGWQRDPVEIYPDNPVPTILSLSFDYTAPEISIPVDAPARERYEGLLSIQTARQQLQAGLELSPPGSQQAASIQRSIDRMNELEAEIRSRPVDHAGECSPAAQQAGVHIILQEGNGPSGPRPAQFGPTSGIDLAQDSASICPRFLQTIFFADRGREFYVAITMSADTSPARRAETYAILDSLRFDRTTTVSTGGQATNATTTTLG
jgi:hypothetical protein